MTTNTERNFCESGKHTYKEVDVLESVFSDMKAELHILVACSKCDSKFLRTVEKPLP